MQLFLLHIVKDTVHKDADEMTFENCLNHETF